MKTQCLRACGAAARWLLVLLVIAAAWPAAAQNAGRVPGMIDRGLMGNPNERQPGVADAAADTIRGAAQAKVGKSDLNASLLSARLGFRAAKSEEERTRTGAHLHEVLDGKDAVFFVLHIVMGTSDEARRAIDGMHQLTGGIPDGGIAESATPAYFAWVDGMRSALGLRSTSERLMQVTREGFLDAQASNKPLHEQYLALRNAVEVRRAMAGAQADSIWKTDPAPYALTPEVMAAGRQAAAALATTARAAGAGLAGLALVKHEVQGFTPRFLNNLRRPDTQMVNVVLAERGAGQKVLQCFYGPTEIVNGQPQYRIYTFWHAGVPASFERMKSDPSGALGSAGPQDRLGQRRALTECPASEAQVDDGGAAAGASAAPAARAAPTAPPAPPAVATANVPSSTSGAAVATVATRVALPPGVVDPVETQSRLAAARTPDGGRALHEEKVVGFDPASHLHGGSRAAPAVRQALRELAGSVAAGGQKVLECSYGPVGGRAVSGGYQLTYRTRLSWHGQAPAELERMVLIDGGSLSLPDGESTLAWAFAPERCPQTSRDHEFGVQAVVTRDQPLRQKAFAELQQRERDAQVQRTVDRDQQVRAEMQARYCEKAQQALQRQRAALEGGSDATRPARQSSFDRMVAHYRQQGCSID